MSKPCEHDEIVQSLLDRMDEHFAHKEHVASQVLIELTREIKTMKEQYKALDDLIVTWNNAKGFLRVAKWLGATLLFIGAVITAVKNIPITWK